MSRTPTSRWFEAMVWYPEALDVIALDDAAGFLRGCGYIPQSITELL